MSTPRCPHCRNFAFLDWQHCERCEGGIGFHYRSQQFIPIDDDGTEVGDERWFTCSNWGWGCNWVVREGAGSGQCFSCRLTRNRPDSSDTIAMEKLAETEVAKRRLVLQLLQLDLPIEGWREREGGLGFDLLSSRSSGERVTIGHANGIITIDLAESLDDWRESLRVKLGEPYRTMLGHLRHEVGHYYDFRLIPDGPQRDAYRALFGDERESYRDAIARHYAVGAPEGWQTGFISEYATMHPWEDFAETFAHYLHITGTLSTAAAAGVRLDHGVTGMRDVDVEPLSDYRDQSIQRLTDDWKWLSLVFNRVNRSMGARDLYPFELNAEVRRKLEFVHKLVQRVASADA